MNILQIIDFANRGGAEREMCLISKEISLRGHNVFIIHPPGPETNQFQRLENDTLKAFEYPLKQKNFIKTILDLRKFIKINNIDLIHSHLYFSDFVSFLSRFGLKNVRHFITLHMYLLSAKPKIPIRKIQIYVCAFLTYFFATKIFAVSHDLCKHTAKKFFVPKKKLVRILNGLDFHQFTIDSNRVSDIKYQYDIKDNDVVLLNLGLLNEEKGQSYIVDAIGTLLKNNGQIKCFLLGSDGGLEATLRQKIISYNCTDRIFLPGFQNDICNWLNVASIYIHPTLNDAMPLSIIEAMYLKRPVIASNLPTFDGLIVNGETGLIVKKNSIPDIVNAISLLINNQAIYDKIQENAYNFVNTNCSINATVDNILKYY